jgi:hypothetical protein
VKAVREWWAWRVGSSTRSAIAPGAYGEFLFLKTSNLYRTHNAHHSPSTLSPHIHLSDAEDETLRDWMLWGRGTHRMVFLIWTFIPFLRKLHQANNLIFPFLIAHRAPCFKTTSITPYDTN